MAQQAPGKSHRQGISVKQLMKMFPTEEAARKWLESEIWPQGPYCPHCGSFNVQSGIKHSSMTHRCRDCPEPPAVQRQVRHRDEGNQAGISRLGNRRLSPDDQSERRFEHEAAP